MIMVGASKLRVDETLAGRECLLGKLVKKNITQELIEPSGLVVCGLLYLMSRKIR